MSSFSDQKRLFAIALGIFCLFALLIVQFFRIQVIEKDKWTEIAQKQHLLVLKEPFQRGRFISNTSIRKAHPQIPQSFVADVQKYHLYIDPESIPAPHRDPIASQLNSFLNAPEGKQKALRKQFQRKTRSRKIAMWLDQKTRDSILDWWLPYAKETKIARNAIFFTNDYQRSYPFGKLLGQVLHTIQRNKDETTKQAIPTGGLELQFNKYLKGKQGKRVLMRSPRNSFETGVVVTHPENGADIHLTINHHLQAIAEEELEKGVKNCKAKGGWAVMMDPFTGEIFALAQYPFFNPQEYPLYFKDPELSDHTRLKPITDANEPGSVMKPFTVATALLANKILESRGEKPIFSPEEKIATSVGKFKGRSKLLPDTHLHYFLNMDMALQKSSNIYMAHLIERVIDRLGKEWYRSILTDKFGFGKKTGIELPAESNGLLPTPGKNHPNGAPEWSGSTPYSLAMGHNIQATSLQLIRAVAIFANGGYFVNPTLIRKIIKTRPDGSQEILLDNTKKPPLTDAERVLSPDIVQNIVNSIKYITKPGGTASRANIWGYTEAAKTGSANKVVNGTYSPTQFCSSCMGFTPVSNPVFVLLVTMDEPQYGYIAGVGKNHMGGVCAAPVFREIASRSLHYLGIPSDDPHGYPKGDPRYNSEKADWVPESRRLQEIYESWNNKGPNNKR